MRPVDRLEEVEWRYSARRNLGREKWEWNKKKFALTPRFHLNSLLVLWLEASTHIHSQPHTHHAAPDIAKLGQEPEAFKVSADWFT